MHYIILLMLKNNKLKDNHLICNCKFFTKFRICDILLCYRQCNVITVPPTLALELITTTYGYCSCRGRTRAGGSALSISHSQATLQFMKKILKQWHRKCNFTGSPTKIDTQWQTYTYYLTHWVRLINWLSVYRVSWHHAMVLQIQLVLTLHDI